MHNPELDDGKNRREKCCNFHSCVLIFSCPYLELDGHNEAEFGMSWCAGFGGSFYNAYFEVWS